MVNMFTLRVGIALTFITASACSDSQDPPCPDGQRIAANVCVIQDASSDADTSDAGDLSDTQSDAAMDSSSTDAGDTSVSDMSSDLAHDANDDASADLVHDSDIDNDSGIDAATDTGADTGIDAATDMGTDGATDTGIDAATDTGTDATTDTGMDTGPGVYDTTGWTMKTFTKNDSASTGTPDSYFIDVDPGSPLSASITGGGSGTWSVNVYGGYSNQLYSCSGSALCQVMLRPEDTTVIVTAITTDIGYYSLTVHYSGSGPQ